MDPVRTDRRSSFKAHLALIALLSVLLFVGCSGTAFTVIGSDEADKSANGFRYYEPAPFVLVYSDGSGGLISKLIYLPDTTQLRSVHPWEFIASNTTKLAFSNGVLTESTLAGDSTAVPKAFVETIQNAAVAAAGLIAAQAGDDGYDVAPPVLYKIVWNGTKLTLIQAKLEMSDSQRIQIVPGIAQ